LKQKLQVGIYQFEPQFIKSIVRGCGWSKFQSREQAKSEAGAHTAVAFAENGTNPTVSNISTDVYREIDQATEREKSGQYLFDD
jgi:hypothetical protein